MSVPDPTGALALPMAASRVIMMSAFSVLYSRFVPTSLAVTSRKDRMLSPTKPEYAFSGVGTQPDWLVAVPPKMSLICCPPIGIAATIGASGHAAKAASKFLSSALGPVTLIVQRIVDRQVRRASVAKLAAATADTHDSDGHEAGVSTIAAADVDTTSGGGRLSASDLEGFGLAPAQLKGADAQTGQEA